MAMEKRVPAQSFEAASCLCRRSESERAVEVALGGGTDAGIDAGNGGEVAFCNELAEDVEDVDWKATESHSVGAG